MYVHIIHDQSDDNIIKQQWMPRTVLWELKSAVFMGTVTCQAILWALQLLWARAPIILELGETECVACKKKRHYNFKVKHQFKSDKNLLCLFLLWKKWQLLEIKSIAKGRRLKAESVYLNCIDTAILTVWSVVLGRYYEQGLEILEH